MALDNAPTFPEDMYATREEGAVPLPTAPRKPISPFGFAKHAVRSPLPAPVIPAKLPDADLPLFTPQAPVGVVTAQALVDTCRLYLPQAEVEKIREAYRYADNAHLGQFRKSGEPYITHPIAVASILASWRMDAETIEAGLMHDVLEDTGTSKREMAEKFGIEVADLVDGVSKLDKLKFSSNAVAQAESFRKMLLAMSRDVRVILVKLADRLHNMRTLGVMRPEKRARIGRETLEIYVPIAHRLGLNNVFRELQELSFANRYPLRYKVLYENVLKTRKNRREFLEKVLNDAKTALAKAGIPCRILGRDKTIYGIYNKMREKHQSFSDALDIYGFRVVVRTRGDCYLALGALHQRWKPVNTRFKDFIAIPKSNGYQSIHTTVIGPDGTPVEFQLRTEGMHRIDEDGMDENNGMNFAEFVAILSGNTDLLEKAKLDNKIMRLEKEQGIFKKERIRAEHKIADNRQEIAAADRTAADMARDAEYVASYAGDRTTRLLNLPQATAEQIGRELHRIAKTYRSGAYGTIGTYAGLNLLVHSEYNWCGTFDRNVFLVEGPSGLKYRCGQYGALLLGFAETSRYPEITLNRLPFMIEEQRRKIARERATRSGGDRGPHMG